MQTQNWSAAGSNGAGPSIPDIGGGMVSVVSLPTQREQELSRQRSATSWQHIRPNSVYIAVIGNHYSQGSWQRIADMMQHTSDTGYACWMVEVQDRCFNPYDALGTMRNEAVVDASNAGFEWLCMVDADILPEKDALLRLLKWDMPIIAPYVVEPGTGAKLHGPPHELNTGLRPVRWTVLSMLLFRTSVFNCVGPRFWGDAIGADEGYHFKTLWHYGHRPYIDTGCQLVAQKKPIYPLATNRLTWEQRQEVWKEKLTKLAQPPDRRPIDPNDPGARGGVYMPFAITPAQAPSGNQRAINGNLMTRT